MLFHPFDKKRLPEGSYGLFDPADIAEADEKWNDANDAEAPVDEAPVGRNSADGAGDDGKRYDTDACDHTKNEHPLVAQGSRIGPKKAMTITRCPKASQSVP